MRIFLEKLGFNSDFSFSVSNKKVSIKYFDTSTASHSIYCNFDLTSKCNEFL